MLVEHTFITTLDPVDIFNRVRSVLLSLSFRQQESSEREVIWSRGNRKPRRFADFDRLPQSVAVSFDRGRVVVAASIHPFRKPHPRQREALLALVAVLESQLSDQDEGLRARQAGEKFDEFQVARRAFNEYITRQKRKSRALFITFLLIVLAMFAGLIFLATQ